MHQEIREWMMHVRSIWPWHFDNVLVLDVGSLDINGNNKYLFAGDCHYTGLDIVPGPNVSVVEHMHEHSAKMPAETYDTIISTDCLEHDKFWAQTLQGMIRLLKPKGLMIFTCAGEGRDEHGTHRLNPAASPSTNDYYGNLTPDMIRDCAFRPEVHFMRWEWNCAYNEMGPGLDTRFWGVKKG